jgi:hypothetical protein
MRSRRWIFEEMSEIDVLVVWKGMGRQVDEKCMELGKWGMLRNRIYEEKNKRIGTY